MRSRLREKRAKAEFAAKLGRNPTEAEWGQWRLRNRNPYDVNVWRDPDMYRIASWVVQREVERRWGAHAPMEDPNALFWGTNRNVVPTRLAGYLPSIRRS